MKTFLFYDTETSGLNPAFDQILTFAAIRCDLNLTEIERYEVVIRLRPDVIPSPMAFLTHGLTIEELQAGVCEFDAAKTIHQIVNTPGTISLGYNSLGFDDEFLRFLFYRNLLDPYSHQYSQGCSRADILPVAVIYHLFFPQIVKWPVVEGKSSLKLENISQANAFVTSGRAHEAMSDVEALLSLCNAFKTNQKIWDYALDFFVKVKEEIRINNIKKEFKVQGRYFRVCLMVSASFGADNKYISPVIHLGNSVAYKNQSLWLRLDAEDSLGISAQSDVSEIMVIRKKPGDAFVVLPMLDRFQLKLTDRTSESMQENLDRIQHQWVRFFELIRYHTEYKYPVIPQMDIDASLYQDGFFSSQEKQECRRFHQADDLTKPSVIGTMQSHRIKELSKRIVFRNALTPTVFTASREWSDHLSRLKSDDEQDRFVGYKNEGKLTVPQAVSQLKEVNTQITSPTPEQQKILEWLERYLSGL